MITFYMLLSLVYLVVGVGVAALIRFIGFPNAAHMLCDPTKSYNCNNRSGKCLDRRVGAKPLSLNEHLANVFFWIIPLVVFIAMWMCFPIALWGRYGRTVRF